MSKKLLLACFVVVWAFIPPAKSELTINIYERDPNAEPLVPISADEINHIPDELEEMYRVSAEMDAHIMRLEKQIAAIHSDINNVNDTINEDFKASPKELDKYASNKVDVAEKETHNGIVYDLDIYDHAKKLNTSSWDEFKEKYNI